jgi:hypothetical protein
MNYLPMNDNAARQLIDSTTVFGEFRRVMTLSRKFNGGMYWKQQGEYSYLVRTQPDNRQHRIGARTPDNERIYENFVKEKAEVEERVRSLRAALVDAERLNKALKVGRVPQLAVAVLQALDDAGLGGHFTVVGTYALYAYESAAGVRIIQNALATQDVDLLWDARKRVQFATDIEKLDSSILRLLQRVDKTFERKEGNNETAINARGFEVDFLRRQPEGDDPHPFRFSSDEGDIWPVQAQRASVLTTAPRFAHVVVSATGRMALMRTIAPQVFVDFKRWLAEKAPNRLEIKRNRDRLQADIVQELLDAGMLLSEAAG